ncbi:MAG: hypothetical protein IT269_11325 [Saprospiraceae bacterium]|nr:hypothetical protein [Saprospiraceae bacterium]
MAEIKMKFDPFEVPMGMTIWEHYKPLSRRTHLSSMPNFQKVGETLKPTKKDLSLLVGFVILLVDPHSPYYDERDFEERERGCLDALHIKPESLVWEVITGNHWWFGEVLTAYFKMINNAKFETWFALKMHAHFQKALVRAPAKPDEKDEMTKLRQTAATQLVKLDEDIDKIERGLFPDAFVKEIINDTVTQDSIVGWAEHFALAESEF